jgi:serine/threonine-protein kinase
MIPPERWRRIEDIFHAALERHGAERARFLDEGCAGDDDLRREVLSLLAAETTEGGPAIETAVEGAVADLYGAERVDLTGTVLGRYRVTARIGRGGMGEVYRAEDTSLGRPVALKVLRREFLGDRDRRARFEHEARAASALNHPNILVVHEIGRAAGIDFIATELVEGDTLDARLASGPLPWREVLPIAIQTAQALAAAHVAGIVHRDVKPHNIMVRPDGVVKVVDFGIAKLAERGIPRLPGESASVRSFTRSGAILGTVCYMSPEQAVGESVDHRSDIFSLGVVLYQMATGAIPFDGPTDESIQDALINRTPDPPSGRRPELPPDFDRTVSRALEKDVELRYQTAGDLAADLKRLQRASTGLRRAPAAGVDRPPASATGRRGMGWMAVAAVASLVAALGWLPGLFDRPGADPPRTLRHFVVPLPSIIEPEQATGPTVVVSPDGRRLVYVRGPVAARQLYVRELNQLEDRPIPGTELGLTPFFSPDGSRLGFFAQGELRVVQMSGGPPSTIGRLSGQRGAAWLPDGSIVAAASDGLVRVPADGGTVEVLARPRADAGERAYQFPEILPDGRTVLYTVIRRDAASGRDSIQIHALRLDDGERKLVLDDGASARYARSGHLVFYRGGALAAVPFDAARAETVGAPVAVRGDVATMPGGITPEPGASFSLSHEGTLVYIPGSDDPVLKMLFRVSRSGAAEPIGDAMPGLIDPGLSPDGKTLAVVHHGELWLVNPDRGSRRNIARPGSVYLAPVWTPDGRRLVYTRMDETGAGIYAIALDDPGRETVVWKPGGPMVYPSSFDPTGARLLCMRSQGLRRYDIWSVRMDGAPGDRVPQPVLATTASEQHPQISPDGRWLAYASDESGRFEVYVQPFPAWGDRWRVSVDGGAEPRWATSGRELFYRARDWMMSVRFDEGDGFVPGQPRRLFEGRYQDVGDVIDYAVAPGAERFIMIRASETEPSYTRAQVLLDWFTELDRLAPRPR